MSAMQADIERLLAQSEPDVEVLLAEIVGGATVRLFIDHPDGVSLELCERVSTHLMPIRERFGLEGVPVVIDIETAGGRRHGGR